MTNSFNLMRVCARARAISIAIRYAKNPDNLDCRRCCRWTITQAGQSSDRYRDASARNFMAIPRDLASRFSFCKYRFAVPSRAFPHVFPASATNWPAPSRCPDSRREKFRTIFWGAYALPPARLLARTTMEWWIVHFRSWRMLPPSRSGWFM